MIHVTRRIGAAVVVALAAAPATAQDVEEILARTREAVGWSAFQAGGSAMHLSGELDYQGTKSHYDLVFDGRGRFLDRIEGPVPQVGGFDGETAWRRDWNGLPQVLEFGDRDAVLFEIARWSGAWLDEESGLTFELDMYDDDSVELSFQTDDGLIAGTLELNRENSLPVRWTWERGPTEHVLQLDDWGLVGGLRVPTHVRATEGLTTDEYRLELRALEAMPDASPQLDPPEDWSLDLGAPAALEVRRAATGHLLVHPEIDGEDIGWFIFDTGAGGNVISTHVVDLIEAESFGSTTARGIGGEIEAHFLRASSLELGPLTVEDPLFMTMDLEFLSAPLGVEIGGVLGYGTIARCVVEYGFADSSIRLLEPAPYRLDGAEWQELVLYHRVPHVRGMLEGEEGLFVIDTGAVGGTSLTVYGTAVKRRGLLEGRDTRPGMAGGVGGMVKVRVGTVDSFELAGHRFEAVPATFATEAVGAFANPYVDGNIGAALLDGFTMVLDYAQGRIAFVELPGG